jgi:hypothetical protein
MATDRSTLPRGPYPAADQRPATAPGGRRPPSAPRERKPVLAALAVLLVAGGAAASAFLVVRTSRQVPAIEISEEVGAGQQIPLSAMQEVQVPSGTPLAYVAWSERAQVTRYFAAAAIPAGTLLTAKMVVQATNVTAGRQVLGLTLKPGQVPAALKIGDHVNIYDTNTTNQNSCPGLPGSALTRDAIVTGLALPGGSSGSNNVGVDIALNPPDAGLVACNAANNWAAIGILPAGGKQAGQPAVTPAPSASPPVQTGGKHRRAPAPTTPAVPPTLAPPTTAPVTTAPVTTAPVTTAPPTPGAAAAAPRRAG